MTLLSMVYCVRYIRYLPNCSNYSKMHIAYSLFKEINQFDKFDEDKLPVDTFLFFTFCKIP